MQARPAFLVAMLALGLTASVDAQSSVDPAPEPPASSTTQTPTPSVDASRLGVSLSRIQRKLQASSERQSRDGLNLRFFVDVYALAPPIVLLTKEDNLDTGRVPDSAPTHQEVLQFLTPRGLTPPPTGRLPRRSNKK